MHLRLGLDELVVDPLEDRIVARRERIMLRLLNGIIGVAARAVHQIDGMAYGASDSGLAGPRVHVVVMGVVELSREERDGVVAPRAPARPLGVAVAFEGDLSRLSDARQIRLVVERAEVVRRVIPTLVRVLMALQAVVVHHQGFGRDELAVGRDGRRREEVPLPLLWPLDAKRPGVLRMQHPHCDHKGRDHRAEASGPLPFDPRPGESMFHIEPDRQDRRGDVQPVTDAPDRRIADLEDAEPHQHQARRQDHQGAREEDQAVPHRRLVRALPGRRQVAESESEERQDQGETEHQMEHEHEEIEVRLLRRPPPPA